MHIERIILTTGGTGGHIFPAIAVAEEIRRRNPNAMILFVGSKHGLEADLAVNAGLNFAGLPVKGVMGRGLKGAGALFGMLRGLAKSLFIIKKVKPQMILGFGGYAAFTTTLAGTYTDNITAIHEQNSFPGMTNRILGKRVDKIFLSLPDVHHSFDAKKTLITGNPVRENIAYLYSSFEERMKVKNLFFSEQQMYTLENNNVSTQSVEITDNYDKIEDDAIEHESKIIDPTAIRPRRLLVMGGSQGASALNNVMRQCLKELLDSGIQIWHQTGKKDYEDVRNYYRGVSPGQARVVPFIADMNKAYAWADLAVCRAGASTLAELTVAGLPAILVPFPQAAQDHQRHNAEQLVAAEAAVVLEQKEFLDGASSVFLQTVLDIIQDQERLTAMAKHSHNIAKPNAVVTIVDSLEELLLEKNQKNI